MVMQPQSQQPNPAISPNPGAGEPDTGPMPAQAAAPAQPMPAEDLSTGGSAGVVDNGLSTRLDALSDQDKKFLAQYMTPEFVYAMGLVAGPDTANYLKQYADPNKVLVPVSREEAHRIQEVVKQQQAGQTGQPGTPQPAPQQGMAAPQPQAQPQQQPQAAQAAPAMKPQPMPQMPQHPLPNGVTPAPMMHGVMAPRA